MNSPAHTLLLEIHPDAARSADWPPAEEIRALAGRLLARLARDESLPGVWQLSLTITDDAGIRVVNRDWRDKDRATDVLSFPQFEFYNGALEDGQEIPPAPEGNLLGDIMISYETCQKQGSEIGHGTRDEFARLLVHGLLHLVGYDHERGSEEERVMQRREDELLAEC